MRAWIGGIEVDSGANPLTEGVWVTDGGIDGWFDLPGVKTALEDRTGRDGAFPVQDRDVVYSPRTVTFHLAFTGPDRAYAVGVFDSFNRMSHSLQKVRVDDVDDTFITGWVETAFPPQWLEDMGEFAVTVTAADPRRFAWDEQQVVLSAGARRGALDYPISYDIDYQGAGVGASPTGAVSNRGNAVTHPVITVHGALYGGFTLTDNRGRAIVHDGDVFPGVPVVVDCGARNVLVDGVNVTWALSRREWFDVPAGESLSVTLQPRQNIPVGQAWAELTLRDAWI